MASRRRGPRAARGGRWPAHTPVPKRCRRRSAFAIARVADERLDVTHGEIGCNVIGNSRPQLRRQIAACRSATLNYRTAHTSADRRLNSSLAGCSVSSSPERYGTSAQTQGVLHISTRCRQNHAATTHEPRTASPQPHSTPFKRASRYASHPIATPDSGGAT